MSEYALSWAHLAISKLIALGADHFFIAPGNRSIPLISAIARIKRAKIYYGIDERSLGFMCLGFAKKHMRPSVIVTTSGTAVANLFPSVVEAFNSEVPMILLTADRPFQYRHSGANQTIDQVGIFGSFCKKSFDLGVPRSEMPLTLSLSIFENAFSQTMIEPRGPVHINVQFDDPAEYKNFPKITEKITEQTQAFEVASRSKISFREDFFKSPKGLIVVGSLSPKTLEEQILKLSKHLSWPIYADILSNLRLHDDESIWHHFEISLLNSFFRQALDVDRIIFLGGHLVSKRFWSFISEIPEINLMRISSSPRRIDPSGRFQHMVVDESTYISAVLEKIEPKKFSPMPIAKEIHQRVKHIIENMLSKKNDNEAFFADRLLKKIKSSCNFFISSSMPIRDLDQFARPIKGISIDIYANRGASGIDGVISTALGTAINDNRPTILLIGDVAFLHDTNALMLVNQISSPFLIVVINNAGGGIFQFLPVREEKDFSNYLMTPHEVNIAHLCSAHSVPHCVAYEEKAFDEMLDKFFIEKRSMVLEVRIEKYKNFCIHQECFKAIKDLK